MHERRWVFDTVTCSNFLLSDSTFILEKRYGGCGILTWQVYDELCSGVSRYQPLKQVDRLIDEGVFRLAGLSRAEHAQYPELIRHLGRGEASCIALAKAQSATVMTDDRAARRQCSRMGVPFSGTIGILKACMRHGVITLEQADRCLARMMEAGFYSPVRSMADIG